MVSIIVPVYNTEKFLRRCIDSIVAQTYSDLEIILVDDGSTDNSCQICDDYAAIDSRIVVIHQHNVGSSLSRIRGIEIAHGDYIQFVDSDDWIELNMVEKLVNKALAERSDIVWCNIMLQSTIPSIYSVQFDTNPSNMLRAIYENKIPAYLVNKIYRLDILQNIEVSDVDMMEDMYYITQILCKNPKMSYISEPLYHYDQTNVHSLTNIQDFLITGMPNLLLCYEYLRKKQMLNEYSASLYNRILKSKIRLVNLGRYKEAQSVLPVTHKSINNYPIAFPLSLLYWAGFNFSGFGRFIFYLLMCLGRNNRNRLCKEF